MLGKEAIRGSADVPSTLSSECRVGGWASVARPGDELGSVDRPFPAALLGRGEHAAGRQRADVARLATEDLGSLGGSDCVAVPPGSHRWWYRHRCLLGTLAQCVEQL